MRLLEETEKELDSLPEEEKKKARDQFTNAIIESDHRKQIVVSGAGTGKSILFQKKVVFWEKQGIDASKVLVLSFINFLADSLQNNLPNCKAFTLHKFAKFLIHKYLGLGKNLKYPLANNFTVALTSCDEGSIAQDIIWLQELNDLDLRQIKEIIDGYFKCCCSENTNQKIIEKYFQLTTFYNCVTFDDSIFRATQILRENPEILDFEKCLVDEYQDFSLGEQALVKVVFETLDGGIITGDDDQSIYSGRKAAPKGIRVLVTNKEWEEGTLPFCSRTRSSAIVKSAIILARKQSDTSRIDKTYLPLEDNAKKIYIALLSQSRFSYKNPDRNFLIEAEFILTIIDKNRLKNWDGGDPEYLILCRTHHHVNLIAKVLKDRGIEFETKKVDVFSDPTVQLLFSYLQLLSNDRNNLAYRRLIGLLEPDSNKQKNLVLKAYPQGFYLLNEGVIGCIKNTLIDLQEAIEKSEEPEERVNAILKCLNLDASSNPLLKEFVEFIKQPRTFAALLNRTEDLVVEEREKERKAILTSPIQCLTVQSSKGLSAETVFLLGLECGYLPKAYQPTDEEIRLIYVAMTRAREDLYLLTCKSRADGVHEKLGSMVYGTNRFVKKPSIFFDWIPGEYKEHLKELSKKDFKNA